MDRLSELRAEQARIGRELDAERRRDDAKKQAQSRRALEAFENTHGVHVGISDDYASLRVGVFGSSWIEVKPNNSLRFYYGYEETLCPVHGSVCPHGDEDCDDSEWAFVVTDAGQEVMRLGLSQLHPEVQEPVEALLCGIGLWITRTRAGSESKEGL